MTTEPTQPNPPTGAEGEKTPTAEPGKTTQQAIAFTPEQQAEINRIVGRRVTEERAKLQKQAEQAKAKGTATEADMQRREAETEARVASTMIKAEIKVRAMALGFVDPDAAYALMDHSSVAYDEATGVSGVDAALTALLAAKPYLKVAPVAKAPNVNPAGGGQPAPASRALTADEEYVALRMFPGMEPDKAKAEYAKAIRVPNRG